MTGYRCDMCGFVVNGMFAERQYRDHLRKHDAHPTNLTPVTATDRAFLKTNRIIWTEREDDGA